MKKILVMLALGFGIIFTTNAQKKNKKVGGFTLEQKTELAVKRMVLELDLTDKQISQIKPLIQEKIAHKQAMREKRKASKDSEKVISSDQKFERVSKGLDKRIAFKNKMKQILSPDQMEKFQKMKHKKRKNGKKGGLKGSEVCKKFCEGKEKSCEGPKEKSCEGKK